MRIQASMCSALMLFVTVGLPYSIISERREQYGNKEKYFCKSVKPSVPEMVLGAESGGESNRSWRTNCRLPFPIS